MLKPLVNAAIAATSIFSSSPNDPTVTKYDMFAYNIMAARATVETRLLSEQSNMRKIGVPLAEVVLSAGVGFGVGQLTYNALHAWGALQNAYLSDGFNEDTETLPIMTVFIFALLATYGATNFFSWLFSQNTGYKTLQLLLNNYGVVRQSMPDEFCVEFDLLYKNRDRMAISEREANRILNAALANCFTHSNRLSVFVDQFIELQS